MTQNLPGCDELFLQFFDPWYDDAGRQRRGFKATFPDVVQHKSFVGLSQEEASRINSNAQGVVLQQIEGMLNAIRHDWPSLLGVSGDISLDWIGAFDEYYDRDHIRGVIERSDSKDFGNEYVVLCCEFGTALGHVLRVDQPRLIWCLDWPYWDSSLLDPKTGTALTVFHWAIKKMSEYGVDDGFVAKINAALQFLSEQRSLSTP